ncbi:hypothetical protein CV770_24220 [Bradyrhizobium sp. AC87j1]|uniref:nitroreductase family protein n=1 Tax=Bradyrhizobium sp. AC87j1 TaxID=2055894 RepID=UPI000CEC9C74|nr:nitroreductase family protein [Bradyrhizobium sp. AC87j1]PPQ16840.1 hypothetical protein CV770_24220 [Bradyrhizobium sp. AC87j1]
MQSSLSKISLFLSEFMKDALLYARYCGVSPFRDVGSSGSYKLVIESHAIEKGLSLPRPRKLFGRAKISYIVGELRRTTRGNSNFSVQMAAGALLGYKQLHVEQAVSDPILVDIEAALRDATHQKELISNPGTRIITPEHPGGESVLEARFSCRMFDQYRVPRADIEKIVSAAQRAPSQCNRQATKVYVFQSRSKIERLLELQGGAAGFGHLVNNLAIVSSELSAWGGAQQRNQPYVDGGLFSLAFLLACQERGYVACPLNLAVRHRVEHEIRSVGGIPAGERLIMMIAFGKPVSDESIRAAASPRRPLSEVLVVE